jgi:serine/threonine protein kinase
VGCGTCSYARGSNIHRYVLGWLRQLIHLVHACHERGVVHRDIKPENILVQFSKDKPDGEVNLIDFNSSTFLETDNHNTPLYAHVTSYHVSAPEVMFGTVPALVDSVKTDIWAIAMSCCIQMNYSCDLYNLRGQYGTGAVDHTSFASAYLRLLQELHRRGEEHDCHYDVLIHMLHENPSERWDMRRIMDFID